jgi:hypothetical protein
MSPPASELPIPPDDTQAELDRFERHAVSIVALALTLSGVSYAILTQVLL